MNIPARDYLVFSLAGTQNIPFIGGEDNWLTRLKSFICQSETNGRWEGSEVKYGWGEPGVSTQLWPKGEGGGLRPHIWFYCSDVPVLRSTNVVFPLWGCES